MEEGIHVEDVWLTLVCLLQILNCVRDTGLWFVELLLNEKYIECLVTVISKDKGVLKFCY